MKLKKIAQEFVACAKEIGNTINRKRDNLCYTTILAASISGATKHAPLALVVLEFLLMAAHRELLRTACWKWTAMFSQPDILTHTPMPMKPFKPIFSSASACTGMSVIMGGIARAIDPSNTEMLTVTTGMGIICVATTIMAGGPLGVIDAYKTMWNWPDKRDGGEGGGIPHLRKAAKAITDVFHSNRPKPPSQNSDPPKYDAN